MAVERSSSPKRRPVSGADSTPRASKVEGAKGPKAQRGDPKKATPQLPKVSPEAVRDDGLATAKANAFAFDLLAASLARAVARAQDIKLPQPLAAFHQALTDVPVTISLKRGHESLRGCLPKDRTERKAVDTFLDLLPMHIQAMGSEHFCDALRGKLTQMLEGPRVLDDLWLGTKDGVYELAVMRVSAGGQAARADQTKGLLAEALRGGPPAEPGKLTQEILLRPYAEADQSVIYGILRALAPMGLLQKPDMLSATGLSAVQLEALAAGETVSSGVPRERVVAGMLRALVAQPKAALTQWRHHIPATEAEVMSLARRLNPPVEESTARADMPVPLPREHVAWPIAPMFANVLDGLSRTDKELVMGVVFARLRTGDIADCKKSLGATAAELEQLIASGSYATPMPPFQLLKQIFDGLGYGAVPKGWYDNVSLDRAQAKELWNRVSSRHDARRTVTTEPVAGSHLIDGKKLFDSVAPRDRAIVNECLNALLVNAFAYDYTLQSMTALKREELQHILAGGKATASIDERALIALALRYVVSTKDTANQWWTVMSFRRADVAEVAKRYAP